MSFLFEISGKVVFPKAETLLIPIFKEIWARDLALEKETAIAEFCYIEFMTSMLKSNPYREYQDEKKNEIIRKDIMPEDWEGDPLIREAMNYIITLQTEGSITYSYWMANKAAIEQMIDFFLNFDIGERNLKSGMPIYKPKDITSAIGDAEKTLTTLNALKVKVDEEVYESSKSRAGKVVSPFANPSSLK